MTGAVYICEHDSERGEIILSLQKQIEVISFAIAAAVLIIAGIFVILLTKRIKELVHSMHIVAGGDYSHRYNVTGQDEISELGNECVRCIP